MQTSKAYALEPIISYLNYYLGHCPQGVTNVKGYYRIVYPNVYPNINMHCYSNMNGVKFYFVIKPGGKTGNIILKFEGADAAHACKELFISEYVEGSTHNTAMNEQFTIWHTDNHFLCNWLLFFLETLDKRQL